jgi:beta-N-acetylhexosaminidase
MALGAIARGCGADVAEDYARQQAAAQARELAAVGVNWNFAPVLDVNNNPDNPIIGVRSYGEDPLVVGRLGAAAISGYQAGGLLACAKHFPGHGDTAVDSHLDLPSVSGGRARLDAVELAPFRAACAAGVGSVMTTHILFPSLDASRPATLSRAILTNLLRNEMGFNGLIVSDCLEMSAIAHREGSAQGAVQAIRAGADVALVCHTLQTQRSVQRALLDAVRTGELAESRVNDAASRMLAAKRLYAGGSPATADPWNDPAHDALELSIARASVTIVRNGGAIPIRPGAAGKPLLISAHPAAADLSAQMDRLGVCVEHLALDADIPHAEIGRALDSAAARAVILATAPREPWSRAPIEQERQAELVLRLHRAAGKRLVVVALREPYDIRSFPEIASYVCTYGYSGCSLRALAEILAGQRAAVGRLPVDIEALPPLRS